MTGAGFAETVWSVWRRRLEMVARWIPEIIEDRDPEPLHQFRVSIRYLLSMNQAFALSDAVPQVDRNGKVFRRWIKYAGPIRDLDVQLMAVERWRISQRIPVRTLDRFSAFLREPRKTKHQILCEQLAALGPYAFHLLSIDARPTCPAITTYRAGYFSGRRTRIKHRLRAAGQTDDPEKIIGLLHTVRIALKSIRYPLSVINEYADGRLGPELITFKQVQDILGRLHDNEVILGSLNKFSRFTGEEPVSGGISNIIDECHRIRRWHLERFLREWNEVRLMELLDNVYPEIEKTTGSARG
ncbi:MAG: CHAD domain-containing protein [Fidelibacterota bacterium]